MAGVKIERVDSLPACTLGEAPFWDQQSESLLYVDIKQGCLHRYFPASRRHQRLQLEAGETGSSVTLVVPVEGRPDQLLVSQGRQLGLVHWSPTHPDQHSAKLVPLVTVDQDQPRNRFNDGKCDHKGQLWAGTMGHEPTPGITDPEKGKLFCFSSTMQPAAKLDKINLSNGLAWNAARTKLYYIDTGVFSVDVLDYDQTTNSITNRRKLVDYKTVGLKSDYPDGMAIDTDGNLWVANYNGAKIICVDGETGSLLRTVDLPIQNPTSLCWAGPHYDQLYVTSTRQGLTAEEVERAPDNGAVLLVTGLGVTGSPPTKVNLHPSLLNQEP